MISLAGLTRHINSLVIHCTASPDDDSLFRRYPDGTLKQTPVQVIDGWHRERGFHRADAARQRFNPELTAVGYHLILLRSGATATGRAFSEVGAHVEGHNAHSLGLCLVGNERFTTGQWRSLANVVGDLGREFKRQVMPRDPESEAIGERAPLWICGHRDLNSEKTCPNFDVRSWFNAGMTPDPANVWSAA